MSRVNATAFLWAPSAGEIRAEPHANAGKDGESWYLLLTADSTMGIVVGRYPEDRDGDIAAMRKLAEVAAGLADQMEQVGGAP